jgi:hypothetical protein
VGVIVGGFVRFGKSYFKEKGKNYATKEDFDGLLEQTRQLTQATKEIEHKMSADTWDRQKRWELKQSILFEASRRLIEMDDSLLSLSSTLTIANESENVAWEEKKAEAYKRWANASTAMEDTRFLVAVVCTLELINAISGYAMLATQVFVALGKKDLDAYKTGRKEIVRKLFVAQTAVRKELGFESLHKPQSNESSAS